MEKYESGIKMIPFPLEVVYAKQSDLNNLGVVKERVSSPEFQAAIQGASDGNVSQEQINKASEYLQTLTYDQDTVSVNVPPVGQVTLKIVDREFNKTIKFETVNSPLPFNLWIQLLPVSTGGCKMKLTIKAELNFFIRKMVEGKLKEGLDKIADMLAMVPYGYTV